MSLGEPRNDFSHSGEIQWRRKQNSLSVETYNYFTLLPDEIIEYITLFLEIPYQFMAKLSWPLFNSIIHIEKEPIDGDSPIEIMVRNNHMSCLHYVYHTSTYDTCASSLLRRFKIVAAKCNNMVVMNWCLKICPRLFSEILSAAAKGGHLDMIIWGMSRDILFNDFVSSAAAGNGHLELLEYFNDKGFAWKNMYVCSEAAHGGHLDIIKWVLSNDCPWTGHIIVNAVVYKHYHIMEYILERSENNIKEKNHDIAICKCAVNYGHIDVLKWLHKKGAMKRLLQVDKDSLCDLAIISKHIHVLIWLHKISFLDRENAKYLYINAVCYGQSNIFLWLFEKGYSFSDKENSVANSFRK